MRIMDIEVKSSKKVLTGVDVCYHTQLPVGTFDRESVVGVFGVRTYDFGKEVIWLLDQEIGIWAKSFYTDIADRRLIATCSADDARTILQELSSNLEPQVNDVSGKYPYHEYPMRCYWEGDGYKGAVILTNPATNVEEDKVIIVSRGNILEFPQPENLNLFFGLRKILSTQSLSGKDSISAVRKYFPQKLVIF